MDAIFYHGHGRQGFKLTSSAASVYDRPVVAAEIYGAFQEDKFTVNTLYQAAMEVFVRGINSLIPHGMWYDTEPQSVRIPPLISGYSKKLQSALRQFNDFAARTSMMLTGGKQIAEIGIIYPIASLQGFYHFEAKDNNGFGKFAPKETDYLTIGDELTNTLHRDFTFIHPQLFLSKQYIIADKQVILSNKINSQAYKVIIIQGGKVISYYTLKKIQQFYNAGGKVIATSMLPTKSAEFGLDTGINRIVKEMFYGTKKTSTRMILKPNGGAAIFLLNPDSAILIKTLDQLTPNADVIIKDSNNSTAGNGRFSYLHKVRDGKQIYYFANSTTDVINAEVMLRGK
nr:glycosyl hydrolase [Mucilaginibacter sp. L294]